MGFCLQTMNHSGTENDMMHCLYVSNTIFHAIFDCDDLRYLCFPWFMNLLNPVLVANLFSHAKRVNPRSSCVVMKMTPVPVQRADILLRMMTSSNGNISRVSGPLCGESTGNLINIYSFKNHSKRTVSQIKHQLRGQASHIAEHGIAWNIAEE